MRFWSVALGVVAVLILATIMWPNLIVMKASLDKLTAFGVGLLLLDRAVHGYRGAA